MELLRSLMLSTRQVSVNDPFPPIRPPSVLGGIGTIIGTALSVIGVSTIIDGAASIFGATLGHGRATTRTLLDRELQRTRDDTRSFGQIMTDQVIASIRADHARLMQRSGVSIAELIVEPRAEPRFDQGADGSLEQLLNLLFEAQVPRTLATAESVRANLPETTPAPNEQCAICFDDFANKENRAVALACDHLFHNSCIQPWLEGHNSCPVCRHPMESDNPEWNARNRERLDEANVALALRISKRQTKP